MAFGTQTSLLVAAAAVALAGMAAAGSTPAAPPVGGPSVERIFWVGSSSSYYNYMAKHVADWLTADSGGSPRYVTHLVWKNATRIHVYLEKDPGALGLDSGQSVLDRIRDGKYRYVVLQVAVPKMPDPQEGPGLDRSLDTYVRAIRDAASEPVFYEQGWGTGEDPQVHAKGEEMIFRAAVRNKVRMVAPCARAWDLVRKEQPNLQLHELPDVAHPGSLGNFLNCCVFYATLTGKAPKNMPRTMVVWQHGDNDQVPPQVRITPAGDVWKNDPGWRDYSGPYTGTVRGHLATIDEPTAAYLEDAAWRACQDYGKRLDAALGPATRPGAPAAAG